MKWTPEEEQLLITNLGEKSYSEIEDLFNEKYYSSVPGFPIKRTVSAIRTKVSRDNLVYGAKDPYQESWKNIISSAKEFRLKSSRNDIGLNNSKHTKILTFSDLHIPFFL